MDKLIGSKQRIICIRKTSWYQSVGIDNRCMSIQPVEWDLNRLLTGYRCNGAR